jgi:hypothetical protein
MANLREQVDMSDGTHVYAANDLPIQAVPQRRHWDRAEALRALIGDRSVVYAIRLRDGIIKIGCSANVRSRRNFYTGSEIVGFRFGDYADEQAIHAQLRSSVARGREYYHPTAEVLAVVNDMRQDFNLPPL